MRSNGINFKKSYKLDTIYGRVKQKADSIEKIKKYIGHSKPICFIESEQRVEFISERIIPHRMGKCPNILLLFSNPHPHSIEQGMFLSPNTNNVENNFWSFMEESGWFKVQQPNPTPIERRQIFLDRTYESKFNFIFHCYYDFPSNDPKEIKKIFGKDFFSEVITSEAKQNFHKILSDYRIKAILVMNKDIYNLIAYDKIEIYIDSLNSGKLVKSYVAESKTEVSIYLSYPTGWHFTKNIKTLRRNILCKIIQDIELL